MKNFKRIIASFITFISLIAINPIAAHAEWKQSGNSWWYSQGGSSYATNWTKINGQWYYFDSDGYMKTGWVKDNGNWYYFYGEGTMAHDTTIDGSYLNSAGAWTTNIPVATTTTSYNDGSSSNSGGTQYVDSNGNGLIKGSKTHIYHVPGGKYYDKTTNVVQWFKTVKEAEAAGYRAPEK